ncbi:MAG: asparagine--tRNA ligase [Candidatus Micrarchaeia archaeon]|jgi:asparaginyl-tRNA synthetase
MIEYLHIKDVQKEEMIDKTVTLRGWAYRTRGSSAMRFIVLRDSTGIIQCTTIQKEVDEKTWKSAEELYVESSFTVKGIVRKDDRAPGGYELTVKELEPICIGEPFPIAKDLSPEFLADKRHLWLRSQKMTAILKIRSTVFDAIHEYFRKQGFYEYHSPIFQAVQCEGGSTLFSVDYFGDDKVFLAQTWQLYAEPAIFSLEKIYTISPSFRAEKSKTSRHLTEYWHAEMEGAWFTFDDVISHGEGVIKYIVKKVLEERKEELKILERDIEKLKPCVEKPFIRMTYTKSLEILKDKCKMKIEWGKDLRTIEEDKLSQLYDTPIIITHYPKAVKAFYMTEDEKDPKTVHGVDFIAPEGYGEIIGGSEREADIEKIKKRLIEQKEDPAQYEFYLDTRKYGSVPHGGFGLGVERIIAWICGLDTIKDAIPFPRTMTRYKP